MHLLVEALGIRGFGGATVLLNLLEAIHESGEFSRVTLVSSPASRRSFALPDLPELKELAQPWADRVGAMRLLFYLYGFRRVVRGARPHALLSMSGMASAPSIPTAVLIQQTMSFDAEAAAAFSWAKRLRFMVIRALTRRACTRAAVILVQSQQMRRVVAGRFGLPESRFVVHIPSPPRLGPGARSNEVAEAMEAVPADRRLLYVGSDVALKNLGFLVEAVNLVRTRVPGVTLFATLPPGHPAGKAEGVVCLGTLDREGLATAYSLATVLCLASLAETVGLPLLEAMAVGLPVLVADRPYAREMCLDAAGYFDPRDLGSFVSEAVRVLGDPELAAERRARGLAISRAREADRAYRQIAGLLAKLGSGGAALSR